MARLYIEGEIQVGEERELPADVGHRVRTVLRLARDAEVILFNGAGGEYDARLAKVARSEVRAIINGFRPVDTESLLDLTLVQSISRGERMDYTIQKAVELGIRHIVPVISRRTAVRLDGDRAEKRLAHWCGIARHAAEQSGRTRLPDVHAAVHLDQWLTEPASGHRFLLNAKAPQGLAQQSPPTPDITIVAGPEGGFDEREIEALENAGVTPVHLGPRTLRTETAAVTALSIVQALWGDLK